MVVFRIILELLIKVLVAAAAVLLLSGAVERERLFLLLGLAVAARGYFLWIEWRKPREGDFRWCELERSHAVAWWIDEQADTEKEDVVPDETGIVRTRSRPEVKQAFARSHVRRTDRDILSEAASLAVTTPGAFLLALMLTSSVVTWTGFDRGPAMLALAAGAALHFAANLVPAKRSGTRVWLRGILMAAVVASEVIVAKARHPYLLAQGATHRRMIAERVWNLGRTVEAGRYAGVLIAYARDLEQERRWADARVVYERALELDAYRVDGHDGLARVLDSLGESEAAAEQRLAVRGVVETVGETGVDEPVERAGPTPVFDWRPTTRLRVCLVPVGEVPVSLLDAAGRRLGHVLEAEVFRWADPLPLPEAGRKSGLLGGRQWRADTLMAVFWSRLQEEAARGRRVQGAWQFLLVTSADLYLADSNYVFAASYPVNGVVSYARFGGDGEDKQAERLAKQLVATAIKCFGVGQAARADCVTAYVRSLSEFDRKPIRPAGPTRTEYRRRVELWERDPTREPAPPN